NLKQINTFLIDIDVPEGDTLSERQIIDCCINSDFGFLPTMILKSPGGYQIYFVLENAWYISNKDNYGSIRIAKRISENLRTFFGKSLPVDFSCNHFGIARIPRTDNVVLYQPHFVYPMQQWIDWSMTFAPAKPKRKNPAGLRVLKGKLRGQVDEPWVKILLNRKEISGTKGVIGRNNALFTLALAHYASGISYQECYDFLDEFNSFQLASPLSEKEYTRTIKSAYSGKYQAASRIVIRRLVTNWTSETFSDAQLFGTSSWYKFKKPREERQNSHFDEWAADLLAYLSRQSYVYKPVIETTKKEILKDLSIPARSLDHVLINLKTTGQIYLKTKRGRGGGIQVSTRSALMQTLILVKQEVQQAYRKSILALFPNSGRLVNDVLKPAKKREQDVFPVLLDLRDTS
ncbi:primase C-terminal domain-containing protein, partial [Enterococcus sp. LJL120]